MDKMLDNLRNCPRAEGEEKVYFAGQKEFEKADEASKKGVPLPEKTRELLCRIGEEFGVKPPF